MSRKFILNSILAISFGAVVGYNTVDYFKNRNSPHRYLASMTMSKIAAEQFSKTLIDLKIKNVDIALLDTDVSTIRISLQAYKPIPAGLTYTWNLPADVQLIGNSQVSGVLPEFGANQTQELILKVTGYSKVKKSYISFSLNGEVENAKFQREALVSSRPEDSFEYVVQQYERSKANEVKVNGKLGKSESKGPIDINKVVH
ncbi:MAG: hypothetical protein H7256_13935 [Bdellovibrio sp.]|nr:hypothetical protein [Bdellovibrio sp.]